VTYRAAAALRLSLTLGENRSACQQTEKTGGRKISGNNDGGIGVAAPHACAGGICVSAAGSRRVQDLKRGAAARISSALHRPRHQAGVIGASRAVAGCNIGITCLRVGSRLAGGNGCAAPPVTAAGLKAAASASRAARGPLLLRRHQAAAASASAPGRRSDSNAA